ncbi:hypothetical protein QUB68_19040 [Microcoleus sp. A006_D1]|uniref:hypothetical protein n=1 Tax=Microcoleus sp. A006_D1 TaxID=3055267 RepID=UPI002FD739A8
MAFTYINRLQCMCCKEYGSQSWAQSFAWRHRLLCIFFNCEAVRRRQCRFPTANLSIARSHKLRVLMRSPAVDKSLET